MRFAKNGSASLYSWAEIAYPADSVQDGPGRKTSKKGSQEILPLRKTGDSFRKIVVTGDCQDPWKDESGVMYVGVIPFLLDKELVAK